jgi:hypothetical protein
MARIAKKINIEATAQNILEVASDKIHNMEMFNKYKTKESFIRIAAHTFGVTIVYCEDP